MSCWNFAETIYRLGAGRTAGRPALLHDELVISYGELRRRATGIASYLQSLDLPAGSHIGHYLRNSNAYMETYAGAGLAGHAHVNVNYRYRDDELIGLANGLDIRVLVYDTEFAERVAAI
ncbi:MAG: AMP-binding protein, partial [Halieaceae bacterium]|nr:AMP-binding protein [Halieaceae bacterium]